MNPADWVRHLVHAAGAPAVLDTPPPVGALGSSGRGASDRDREAWRRADSAGPWRDLVEPGSGPLKAWTADATVEVWTEEELASLHGLWRLARRARDAGLRLRLLEAARWHMEHTQPDNATNRPWALHLFVLEGSADGGLYAQTLLHNAAALRASVEPVSAWILRDAAAELQASLRDGGDR